MPNARKLSIPHLQKALQALNIINQTYGLSEPTNTPDVVLASYYLSLPAEDWISPIVLNGVTYGSMSIQGEVLSMTFTGAFTNIFNFLDSLRLEFDESFYGIDTFVAHSVRRIYNSLHYQLQNLLLTNPKITKIQLIGFSYGSALVQMIAVLLYKMIKYHSGAISEYGENTIDSIYSNYLAKYFTAKSNPSDPIFKAIQNQSAISGSQSFLTTLKQIDKSLFTNIQIDSVHAFSPLNVFSDSILADTDLNINKSIADLNLGLKSPEDFFSVVFCYSLPNDPIAGIIDSRTFLGKIFSFFTSAGPRLLIGQIIKLGSTGFMPTHEYLDYVASISNSLNNAALLNIYSHLDAPVMQPFPLFVLPYVGFRVIRTRNILYILLGIAMIIVGIVVPILLMLILYNTTIMLFGWNRL